MNLHPIRLRPGADLRASIEQLAARLQHRSGFVVSGIGSLTVARLRMAGEADERLVQGPLEIISLAGSVSPDGAHLHMSVADAAGTVLGGHVCPGCEVRTTAELLVAELPGFQLSREFDAGTGFKELVIRPVRQDPLLP
ncbi:MAG: DNA-binding protein [Rubrivivax sp.]